MVFFFFFVVFLGSENVCLLSNVVHYNSGACLIYFAEMIMYDYCGSFFLTFEMVLKNFTPKYTSHIIFSLPTPPTPPVSSLLPPKFMTLSSTFLTHICTYEYINKTTW